MRKFTFLSIPVVLFLFAACGEKQDSTATATVEPATIEPATEETYQDPEEAMAEWGEAWRSNDPAQIQELIADDAILLLNGAEVPQERIKDFIQGSGPVLLDLKLDSRKKGSTERLAFDTGIFTHKNANKPGEFTGSYTFVWERDENEEDWNVKVMNISNALPGEQMHPAQQQAN